MNILTTEFRDSLNLLPIQAEETAPQDDLFKGHPGGAYRELAFVLSFDLLLIIVGAALFWAHVL